MIGKIVLGSSFSRVVNYLLDEKKNAKIIDSNGVRLKNADSIVDSFLMQQEMLPNIKSPVYHISLNFSAKDKSHLSDDIMASIAKEYIEKMNIKNTQYIIVRHFDKEHPHIHLCINRINNEGKLISNRNDRYRCKKICEALTSKHQLYIAKGKEKIKIDRLREPDRTKYQIYNELKEAMTKSSNWSDLQSELARKDIELSFKYKGKTNEIQGVVFSKNGYSFNGSKIDRSFSYSKINQILTGEDKISHSADRDSDFIERSTSKSSPMQTIIDAPLGILGAMGASAGSSDNEDRKRKRNRSY
ncbi:relaxase/mobilization nuclease domain-containing protein [Bacteroides sp. 224]|uniref:relaxase/mobilization nuclease domain-containing protein n=1 Tax=Bacteroides sp. 224 TaxID=2302936 RepID=UPI0013CFF08B|nr:relaxase/mobilization nuclease domain-containing protein [Bacteroides sp. 224]NDV66917.1 mobilization protein [Bacteroides sp. 224]